MTPNDETLEKIYQENLEERIIAQIARSKNVTFEKAMDSYYNSHIANLIHNGKEGIQYLDYKVLAEYV